MTGRTPGLLWAGIACLAIFALMGAAVMVSPGAPWTQALDDGWRRAVGVGPDSPVPLGPVAMFFQHVGQGPGSAVLLLALPIALVVIGRWRSALFVIAVQLAGPGLVSQLAKNIVDRPRPAVDEAAGLFGPLFMVDHGSFPSGHAVSAAAAVITVIALIPASRRGWRIAAGVLGLVLAAGMVWQRTLINAHWLSDAVAGLFAGAGVALVLWWAFEPWLRSDHARRPWFARRRAPAPAG